jgi:flagellar biosynthetic protein FlhB
VLAVAESALERTQQATPKRLADAWRKGQIPRSRDLTAAAVTLAGGVALYILGGSVGGAVLGLMSRSFSFSRAEALDANRLAPRFAEAAGDAFLALAPVLGVVLLAALLAPLALGGWSFSMEPLAPKLERLNPLQGLRRMFALRSLVDLAKALAKFGVVAVVAVIVLWGEAPALLALGGEPSAQAIAHAFALIGKALASIAAGLLIIAAFDAPYQLWQYFSRMKMSRQEIRDEYKETEGSPELKARIREMQQQLARRRMMQEVPKADVVVTNPTHFAVALRYDDRRMRAPVVVAKGVDLTAARIREIATEHAVPIFEAPPLARVLYRNVEIGEEIPASLYVAVAQVLSYVFQLRVAKRSGGEPPPRPTVDVRED